MAASLGNGALRSGAMSSSRATTASSPGLRFSSSLSLASCLVCSIAARAPSACFALVSAAFYYVFSSYPYWDGMASFGNRFFLSLTPIFVFGLAILFQRVDLRLRSPRWLLTSAAALVAAFVLWNAGLIYQWGAHLIPARGPVSFRQIARNQVSAVPR